MIFTKKRIFGTNIFSNISGSLQLNLNDELRIEVTKDDVNQDSKIELVSTLI